MSWKCPNTYNFSLSVMSGAEKIVNPGEEVLSHPEEAIVVKMVSAAMYYVSRVANLLI